MAAIECAHVGRRERVALGGKDKDLLLWGEQACRPQRAFAGFAKRDAAAQADQAIRRKGLRVARGQARGIDQCPARRRGKDLRQALVVVVVVVVVVLALVDNRSFHGVGKSSP